MRKIDKIFNKEANRERTTIHFGIRLNQVLSALALSAVLVCDVSAQDNNENISQLELTTSINSNESINRLIEELRALIERLNVCKNEIANIGIRLRNGNSLPEDPNLLSELENEVNELKELITRNLDIVLEFLESNQIVEAEIADEQYSVEQIEALINLNRAEVEEIQLRRNQLEN
jgi:hypothetical protein